MLSPGTQGCHFYKQKSLLWVHIQVSVSVIALIAQLILFHSMEMTHRLLLLFTTNAELPFLLSCHFVETFWHYYCTLTPEDGQSGATLLRKNPCVKSSIKHLDETTEFSNTGGSES